MNVFRCYTREELRSFLLGTTDNEKCDEIAAHLDECGVCEDTVVGLESSSDTLVSVLGKPPAKATDEIGPAVYQQNPDFDRALKAAHQIGIARSDGSYESSLKQIGDYEIVETLARGGMGSVFRARHLRLEKEVAIKILPERKMQNADAIARFSREMKIIGKMSHPAMVAATDAGKVMEFITW